MNYINPNDAFLTNTALSTVVKNTQSETVRFIFSVQQLQFSKNPFSPINTCLNEWASCDAAIL